MLSDFMANQHNNHTRISIFNNAIISIIKTTDCKALHFLNTIKVVNPKVFVEKVESGELVPEALNVRFFNIQGTEDMLMDTVGLSVYGLPDLQCHFRSLDPNEIARVLFNSGYYIFSNGDIIDDGQTIQGIKKDDKWRCQHEESLVEPRRIVIDINPGTPYAAGNR